MILSRRERRKDMKSVRDAIMERRSVRSYFEDKVTEEEMQCLLEAGNWAPTGRNVQNLFFVGILNPVVLSKVKELLGGGKEFYDAPALILVMEREEDHLSTQNASAAMENMMLQATELGLGSCWIHCVVSRLNDRKKELMDILSLPEEMTVLETLVVGKAKEVPQPKKRNERNIQIL